MMTPSEKSEFQSTVVQLLVNISRTLDRIHETLNAPPPEELDVEALAIHYLFKVGPKVSEIARKLEGHGIKVRRQSLTEAKKFSRFQEKLEIFRAGEIRQGFVTDDGDVEAFDAE